MSPVYLYAILGAAPRAHLGLGIADEPLTLLASGDVLAAVGAMGELPAASRDAVVRHDAVVRRLAEATDAVLPARFGMVRDVPVLVEWLTAVADALHDALVLVAGREQMTLHVFGGEPPTPSPTATEALDDAGAAGPGTRYLGRRRAAQRAVVPELASLRERLDGLVAAERVELRATPPLRATVYHLVERGRSGAYRDAIASPDGLPPGVRLRVSGPWAPYAFAAAAIP